MKRAWKIAPGKRASQWETCETRNCILIGWAEVQDYSSFDAEPEVLKALRREYGPGAKGAGRGAAQMIWQFVHAVQVGDVVIANRGYRDAVGIGIVRSRYLRPGSRNNPSTCEWLPHARRVEWQIVGSVTMPPRFFEQRTLDPLRVSECEAIRRAFADCNPRLRRRLDAIFADVVDESMLRTAADLAPPERATTAVSRIIRDTATSYRVKRMHGFRCQFQFCRKTIKLADGSGYAEAHHIRPLGGEHQGPDDASNILCVCPNHHAMLDLGTMRICLPQLHNAPRHQVARGFVQYHNRQIYGQQ